MAKGYLPYDIERRLLLPPDMRAWLPEGHLALFILDVVGELDLSQIYVFYNAKDDRLGIRAPVLRADAPSAPLASRLARARAAREALREGGVVRISLGARRIEGARVHRVQGRAAA